MQKPYGFQSTNKHYCLQLNELTYDLRVNLVWKMSFTGSKVDQDKNISRTGQ